MVTALTTFALAATMACRSAPAGPSPVPETIAARSLPAGLDPAYVRSVAVVNSAGQPKRWEGGPFRHCFAPDVDAAALESTARLMTEISGIPRTTSGPCNVEWVVDEQQVPLGKPAAAKLSGTDTAIFHARVAFRYSRGSSQGGIARHEAGHILGLNHSPREGDLMSGELFDHTDGVFSADELAVLAWMYQ